MSDSGGKYLDSDCFAEQAQVGSMVRKLAGRSVLLSRIPYRTDHFTATSPATPQSRSTLRLRLHRLQKSEDRPECVILQNALPIRHPLIRPAVCDGEVEHLGHPFSIANP